MVGYIWKHIPYAIYLDTNILRSAGPFLNAPWINELLSITNEFKINICISDLVLREWCEDIMELIENHRRKILSSIDLLKQIDIQMPDIKQDEIKLPDKIQLIELISKKLEKAGFLIIKNWDAPLSVLLNEAIEKKPPFEQHGKGLCDAIILESYIKHSKENFSEPRILVISNDAAVKRSEGRFKDQGIAVDFLSEKEIVGKLTSLLSDELSALIAYKESRLKKYILERESEILAYVEKTPLKITDWMLRGSFTDEDHISDTIERIISIKPTKITNVIGGTPIYGENKFSDRYPVQVFVEIELDIIVSKYILGNLWEPRAIIQADRINKNSPVTLEERSNYQRQEMGKTIKRSITVYATLDAEKEKRNIFDDFRIEKII